MKKLLITVLLSAIPSIVLAHHSAAPFDFTQSVVLNGEVKEFSVKNPHSVIVMEITDEERGTRDIEFEGMSASTFYRAGYSRGTVELGDTISVTIAPRHSGEDGGFVMSFETKDGESFGFSGP